MKAKKIKLTISKVTSIQEDLRQAAKEVRLHKQSKLKLKTAKELLDEL